MVDTVAQYWADDPPIKKITDTELVASRDFSTRVTVPDDEFPSLVETVRQQYDLDDFSETLDFAIRVEIAHRFDATDTELRREDFDVRYLIPERGWTRSQVFSHPSIVEYEYEERSMGFSMPPIVRAMVEALVDEGIADDMSSLAHTGIRRLVDRL